jgi:DNA polymerase-4
MRGDLAAEVERIEALLSHWRPGSAHGRHLHDLAWGRDPRRVVPDEPDRSIGAETTFATDLDDAERIHANLLRLADRVGARLRSSGQVGRTIQLKLRFADFTTLTRSRTLPHGTDVSQEIYQTARALFTELGLERVRIRLVGVRVEGLIPVEHSARQLALGEAPTGQREAERAVDALRSRFGSAAIRPARLVDLGEGD